MTALRSFVFLLWFTLLTLVMGIAFLPLLAGPRRIAARMSWIWCHLTLWGLRVIAGIDMRVTGAVPKGPALIAAKHMSMWDTLAIYLVLGDPAVVLKRQLLHIPFYGWYLRKTTAIAIDREGGAAALRGMARAAQGILAAGRPIVIFPEGTRTRPGAHADYKPGVAGLYALLGVPCVPVALDSGRYWTGFLKKPGTITLAFLETIPPGLRRSQFMPILEERIETATNALLA